MLAVDTNVLVRVLVDDPTAPDQCHIVERLLGEAYGAASPAGRPGLILFVQTFGDPLICPICKGSMRVIALIEDEDVVRRILNHLGCWAPRETRQRQRAPPQNTESVILESIYHPVPDIA